MRFLLFFASLFLFTFLSAQPQVLWQKKVQNDSLAVCNHIFPTSDGNFVITRFEMKQENLAKSIIKLMKITPDGETIWEKIVEKSNSIRLFPTLDSEQNLWGIVYDLPINKFDAIQTCILHKWDKDGNLLIEVPIPQPYILTGALQILPSGEILTGLVETQKINDSTQNTLYGLAKLNAKGEILWTKTYNPPANRRFSDISFSILANHKLVFAASTGLPPKEIDWKNYPKSDTQGICLITCTEKGEEISRKILPIQRSVSQIQASSEGDFLIIGSYYDKVEEENDISICKVSATSGTLLWETICHIQKQDYPLSINEAADKHILVSGAGSGSWLTNSSHTFLLELDAAGKILWTKVFRDGNLIYDTYKKADESYLCVGLFAEKYVYQDEDAPRKKTTDKSDAIILSLSPNACLWEKTMELPGFEQAYCLEKAKDKGYFVAGIDFNGGYGGTIFVFKINETGDIIWRENLGSWDVSMEVPVCLAPTDDGGCVAVTNSDKIFKLSAKGEIEWKNESYHFKHLAAIAETKEGNFVIAGQQWTNYPKRKSFLAEISPKGKEIWQKEYGIEEPGEIWDMGITQNGDYIIAQDIGEIGKTSFQIAFIPQNSRDVSWQQSYETREKGKVRSLTLLSDGGFAIAGISFSKLDKYRASIVKTNKNGKREWSLDLVTSDDEASSVVLTSDSLGNIFLAATHKINNYKGEQEIYVCKINLQGKILWEKYIGGANSHDVGGICLTPDNQILIVGYTDYQHHTHNTEVYLAKVRNE